LAALRRTSSGSTTGDSAALSEMEQMIPLPVVGHWMKQAWGVYYKASKRKQVPRIPGM
jgi:sulfide:quinone oxidoreductase